MPRLAKLRRPGHGEKLGACWRIVWLILYGPFSLLIRNRYRHLDRIPQSGPAILIVNHVSHVDPFLVAKMVIDAARTPRFLAKDSHLRCAGRRCRDARHGAHPGRRGYHGRAPVAVRGGRRAAGGQDHRAASRRGRLPGIPDGWPMAGKTGAARLAMLAPDVPVIPVAQWGVQNSIDLYRRRVRLFPRPRHTLSIGEPLDLSRFHASRSRRSGSCARSPT